MSDHQKPEPSGPGLHEIQRIQVDRLAEAKPRTCGDCKHYVSGSSDGGIPCNAPVPFWTMPRKPYHWPTSIDLRAGKCPCFERKDPP